MYSLFLFCGCGLFPVSGCVNCAGLGFRLGFGGIYFSGLAESVSAGDFHNRHDDKILMFDTQIYPLQTAFLHRKTKKTQKNVKIIVRLLVFTFFVVPLYPG